MNKQEIIILRIKNYIVGFICGWFALPLFMFLTDKLFEYNFDVRHVESYVFGFLFGLFTGLISGFFTLNNLNLKRLSLGIIVSLSVFNFYHFIF